MEKNFNAVIKAIQKENPRFKKGAYLFVREGLDYTMRSLHKSKLLGQSRHVTGQQFAHGMRQYALEQYGPLALTVLNYWGIERTDDFGEIVFQLIDFKVLGKTDSDQPEHFGNLFDFKEAFEKPFKPSKKNAPRLKPAPPSVNAEQ
jgi:uncharacterized repeat protein (TIGR04138 family)